MSPPPRAWTGQADDPVGVTAFLGLGSNLGDRLGNLQAAVGALRGVLDKDLPLGAEFQGPGWEPLILRMERALLRKEPELARSWLPELQEYEKPVSGSGP